MRTPNTRTPTHAHADPEDTDMSTTVYVVTFKSDTYCFGSGPGTYAVEYDMGDLAAQFAASLAGTDAYDVEVEAHEVEEEHEEECEGGDPGELVLVQLGPAL